MNQSPLDIFRVERQGVLWIESAPTLEDANARIQQLAACQPGQYVVLNHRTGNKVAIDTQRPQHPPGDRTASAKEGGDRLVTTFGTSEKSRRFSKTALTRCRRD